MLARPHVERGATRSGLGTIPTTICVAAVPLGRGPARPRERIYARGTVSTSIIRDGASHALIAVSIDAGVTAR